MTTTFLLIRHAAHGLLGHTMAGRMLGVHLNAAGQVQAETLAERLAHAPLAALYSSPLERAQETAAPLAARLSLPVQTCAEITELDYGDWTGLTLDALHAVPGWQPYNLFRSGTRIPGGEMMLEAQARIVRQLQSWCAQYPEQTVALVSHADIIKGAVAYTLGVPLDLFQRIEISPASVSILSLSDYGPKVLCINNTSNLYSE